ncbi:MAG: DUF1841 family protein [Burkholderiaceae bacterium]|nr:DUF1841 family protein [Burkholderiaceae bacterium]
MFDPSREDVRRFFCETWRKHGERLLGSAGSPHEAAHALMECLGDVVWRAQRDGAPPDATAYLDCAARRAGVRGQLGKGA